MIEFFLGFVAIVFAFAGAALIASTKGGKTSSGKNVNIQEAVGIADTANSRMKNLSRLYNPVQFDQYLENIQGWMKDNVSKIKEASQYLMQREKQIASELYRKQVENAQKYLRPLEEVRSRLEAPLKKFGLLYEVNKLENAGYIGKEDEQKAGKEIIDIYNVKDQIAGRESRLYNFLTRARMGLARKK